MARPEKVATVAEIREKLAGADAAVLTEYRGLKVTQLADLRTALRPAGTEFKIFKNTLARRAAEEAGLAELIPMLEGPTAIAFVSGDAVMAAKALRDFSKIHPELVVKGGLLGTKVLIPTEIDALAEVPPREVLLARLAGGFQAPLVKAAGLFQAFTRNMAYGLKALIDQRIEGGEVVESPVDETPVAETPVAETPVAAEIPETTEVTGRDVTEESTEPSADVEAPASTDD